MLVKTLKNESIKIRCADVICIIKTLSSNLLIFNTNVLWSYQMNIIQGNESLLFINQADLTVIKRGRGHIIICLIRPVGLIIQFIT